MDQATELRHLVADFHSERRAAAARLRLIVVAGGKGGVGTTSVAVCLAQSLNHLGARVALVDADFGRADVAKWFDVHSRHGILDVLGGQRDVGDIVVETPCGIRLVPGAWSQVADVAQLPRAKRHFWDMLQSLDQTSDWTVVDAGNQPSRIAAAVCPAAHGLLLVTTTDDLAVIDTYAALKNLGIERPASDPRPNIGLLVNRTLKPTISDDVHRRVAKTAHRFLGVDVEYAGHLPPGSLPTAIRANEHASTGSNHAAVIIDLAKSLITKSERIHSTATPLRPMRKRSGFSASRG